MLSHDFNCKQGRCLGPFATLSLPSFSTLCILGKCGQLREVGDRESFQRLAGNLCLWMEAF